MITALSLFCTFCLHLDLKIPGKEAHYIALLTTVICFKDKYRNVLVLFSVKHLCIC